MDAPPSKSKSVDAAAPKKTALAIRPDTGRVAQPYGICKAAIRLCSKLYLRVKVEGAENLPATGPCLLLSTHASYLDPLLVGSMVSRECHFLARTGVTYAPLIGAAFREFNTHAIRREGIDRDAIKTCAAVLEAGWPLILFPEGTRSPDGRVERPKWGFGMIIEKVPKAPCIPVVIGGNARAWGRGMLIPLPRRVTVTYGKPFLFDPRREGEPRREFYERCVDRLMAEWVALGAQVRPSE